MRLRYILSMLLIFIKNLSLNDFINMVLIKTSSIRTKMRPINVRMKEFSWIFLNLLEFSWIYLNILVLLSSELHFRDIWETRDRLTDGPMDRRTHGPTDKASSRDARTHLKRDLFFTRGPRAVLACFQTRYIRNRWKIISRLVLPFHYEPPLICKNRYRYCQMVLGGLGF